MHDSNPAMVAGRKSQAETYLRIGEVAQATGLTHRTILYYEEIGLLPTPARTRGDYRLFSRGDLSRLGEIIRLKSLLGFSLAEIKQIVAGEEARSQLYTEYHSAEGAATGLVKLAEATRVTEAQAELLEGKINQMVELSSDFKTCLERYRQKRIELEILIRGKEQP